MSLVWLGFCNSMVYLLESGVYGPLEAAKELVTVIPSKHRLFPCTCTYVLLFM